MYDLSGCGVYIMTNTFHTVFYAGMSTRLQNRIWTHKQKLADTSFTYRYNVTKLVYFENAPDKWSALTREKQIKKYSRFHSGSRWYTGYSFGTPANLTDR